MSTQLTYRGTAYQIQTQTVEMTGTQQFVQYRGLSYSLRRPVNIPQSDSKLLKYRGIAYTTGYTKIPTAKSSQLPVSVVPAFN